MTELKGKPVADRISDDVRNKIEELKKQNREATLATVRVGEKPDDIYYETGATKRMQSVGINVKNVVLAADITEADLISELEKLNGDDTVSGILLFMPLPKHIDGDKVRNVIAPSKDIDGLTDENALKIYKGDKSGYAPCTPSAVIELCKFYGIELSGKNVVIIGRSMVVGKPLAMLMLAENATVTVCHRKTENIAEICKKADIIVASAGMPKFVKSDYVTEKSIVIDVGINNDENGNMCGDVDYNAVKDTVSAITPVPGGVGSITTSILAKHIVKNL